MGMGLIERQMASLGTETGTDSASFDRDVVFRRVMGGVSSW